MKGIYLRIFCKIEIKNDIGKFYFLGKGDIEFMIEFFDVFIFYGVDG